MAKSSVDLEVKVDTSQAKKGLQELNKTEVRTPLEIDTKEAKKEIQQLSKTKVEIDLNFDPKKVKKSVEGATDNTFKRYSKTKAGAQAAKMPSLKGGGLAGYTGAVALFLQWWNSSNKTIGEFDKKLAVASQTVLEFRKKIEQLNQQAEEYAPKGGKEKNAGDTDRWISTIKERKHYERALEIAEKEESDLSELKAAAVESRNETLSDAPKQLWEKIKGFGGKGGEWLSEKIPGGGMLGKLGIGGGSVLLGATAAIGASKMWYDAVKGKIDEGQGAQKQIEAINASLGTMAKNFTGSDSVQGLTDQLMLMGVQGVNSVENLTAAASTLMLAFQGNQAAVAEWLPYIDDMAAATGMSAEQMANLIAQSAEAETVDSRLFSSIARQGIPIYDKLAEVIGTTTEKAKEMAKQGQVSAKQFQDAFKSVADTVKGTSAALSSMTLEGAEASFKASGELEHAGWARGYNQARIAYLNQLTEEQLKNAEDAIYQINSEGAGAAVAAVDNMWQSVVEWFDGVIEHILTLPSNLFGFSEEARRISFVNMASDATDKSIRANELIKKDATQEEVKPHMEELEKEIAKFREMLYPDYQKIFKEAGSTFKASEIIANHPRNLMHPTMAKHMESALGMMEKELARLTEYYQGAKSPEQIASEKEAEREKNNREEWERMRQEKKYTEGAKGDSVLEFRVLADAYAKSIYGEDIKGVEDRHNLLSGRWLAGHITEAEKKEFNELTDFIEQFNKDLEAVRKRELDIRKKLDDELEKEAEAKIVQEMQLAQMFKDPNAVREWNEREMRGKLNAMNHIDEPMKEYFFKTWVEDQETRDYRKYAAAMGKNKYKGEEMLQDEIDDINKLTYLTQEERDKMIEAARAKLLKEMQSTTEEGTLLGVNTLTGEKIYGTADAMEPKNKDAYIHNAWGAACRVITQFDTNWDQKQYDELQKSTKANIETAKGINLLNQKALGPIVQ